MDDERTDRLAIGNGYIFRHTMGCNRGSEAAAAMVRGGAMSMPLPQVISAPMDCDACSSAHLHAALDQGVWTMSRC